ncbi:TauD/TfdA family dioxygenase [Bordetella genomosp. 13]|uniref:TauD/TfdA family dioxygenase n=1 Tax=Bordetella genomosp. 13 TaxID=463040 RepID=UPI00119CE74D|nr:TauD/TfdA family dioxygenase [Bordetella genomosp. 13]
MSMIGKYIDSPGAWKGPDIDWTREGLHVLSDDELREIDLALKHLLSLGNLDFPQITRQTFPLDKVGALMESLPQRLRTGRGFLMLRGLPRQQYSDDDMTRIYFGLGAYIGTPMTQSYLGDILGHVMDVSDYEPKSRGYRKGGGQLMHTDSCDIIGLMCLRSAISGGESRISSALAVHNVMAEQYPEQLKLLADGLFLKRTDEDGRRATRTFSPDRVPFFYEENGEVSCYLPTGYARLAEKSGQCPFTAEESEALYRVRKVAASPELYLDMGFKEGDIQFLNNRMMVHGRTDYQDAKDLADRRHLLRLWFEVPTWPAMPQKQIFHTAEDRRLWSQYRQPLGELPSIHYQKLLEGVHGEMVD